MLRQSSREKGIFVFNKESRNFYSEVEPAELNNIPRNIRYLFFKKLTVEMARAIPSHIAGVTVDATPSKEVLEALGPIPFYYLSKSSSYIEIAMCSDEDFNSIMESLNHQLETGEEFWFELKTKLLKLRDDLRLLSIPTDVAAQMTRPLELSPDLQIQSPAAPAVSAAASKRKREELPEPVKVNNLRNEREERFEDEVNRLFLKLEEAIDNCRKGSVIFDLKKIREDALAQIPTRWYQNVNSAKKARKISEYDNNLDRQNRHLSSEEDRKNCMALSDGVVDEACRRIQAKQHTKEIIFQHPDYMGGDALSYRRRKNQPTYGGFFPEIPTTRVYDPHAGIALGIEKPEIPKPMAPSSPKEKVKQSPAPSHNGIRLNSGKPPLRGFINSSREAAQRTHLPDKVQKILAEKESLKMRNK